MCKVGAPADQCQRQRPTCACQCHAVLCGQPGLLTATSPAAPACVDTPYQVPCPPQAKRESLAELGSSTGGSENALIQDAGLAQLEAERESKRRRTQEERAEEESLQQAKLLSLQTFQADQQAALQEQEEEAAVQRALWASLQGAA